MIKPFRGRLCLKLKEAEEQKQGSIFIPGTSSKDYEVGSVVSKGEDIDDSLFKVGDTLLFYERIWYKSH